jgi:hypothetical protein
VSRFFPGSWSNPAKHERIVFSQGFPVYLHGKAAPFHAAVNRLAPFNEVQAAVPVPVKVAVEGVIPFQK